MTPVDLLRHVESLQRDTPRHKELEQTLQICAGFGQAWYGSQKEHWQRWLAEYSGPGAYGRTPRGERPASYVYYHIRCTSMLLWLAEAASVLDDLLERGYEAVVQHNCGTKTRKGTPCRGRALPGKRAMNSMAALQLGSKTPESRKRIACRLSVVSEKSRCILIRSASITVAPWCKS
ncbi:MAG TPA: hypothetical protein ENK34_10645 [Rhodobacteraceae bacterium]|nr:hypothetical protein [Paracoccaceae bacterium]